MYLHARTFCALTHTPIPMGAINFYMRKSVFYTHWYHFYYHVCNVFSCKNVLYTLSYVFYSHGCNVKGWNLFLIQCSQTGFVTVDELIALYTCSYIFYSHGCNKFLHEEHFLHSLIPLLFPWVQCQSLKPVLSQCCQTGFVTVDEFYFPVQSLICLLFP